MAGNIGAQRPALYHRAQLKPRPRSFGSNRSPPNLTRNFSACSGSAKQYVYFHGDAVIFAEAPDDTKAASILQTLP